MDQAHGPYGTGTGTGTTTGTTGTGGLPLAGAILCSTSIPPEQRSQLAVLGSQMGATIKLDLTSDVTHLIVGNTDSAKYRYVARSRPDVKVLSPAWLDALRDVWIEGEDTVDLAALEAEHRLPTFFGLKICLTGFDNPEQRRYIQEAADRNGAEYHGDLTKAVTHLIAATPSGKKYEHALSWHMKIVSLEWFEQSLERGMVLDESLYNPTLPVQERGRGAWDRREHTSPSLGKRPRDVQHSDSLKNFRRKLRRSASAKMGSQSQALWANITADSLGPPPDDEDDDWTDDHVTKQNPPPEHTPAMHVADVAFAENHAASDQFAPADAPRHQPPLPANSHLHDGIFQGRVVLPHGFDQEKTAILRQHLESQGAQFAHQDDLNTLPADELKSGFLVVPFDKKPDVASLPERAGSMNLVTNFWVERCLYGKRLVDPAGDVFCRPLDKLSVLGFSALTINSTGFVGIELLHVTKVVTLMGAMYDEHLSSKTDVIICRSGKPNEHKVKFATDRRIPAVHAAWLWECVRAGKLQPYTDFQLNTLPPQPVIPKSRTKPSSPVQMPQESFELQRRKVRVAQPETNKSRRSRTLDLAASVDPTPAYTADSSTNPKSNNSSIDYYSNSALLGLDGSASSLPLQDINANSPRQPSTNSESKSASRARSSSAESLIRPLPHKSRKNISNKSGPNLASPTDVISPPGTVQQDAEPPKEPPEEKDYSDILAQLRANRKPLPSSTEQGTASRRRGRRQLGRATSTRSNQSTADSANGTLNLDEDEDREKEVEYQPSQELGWDSPGAAKAREQMIKRIGGRVTEKSVRVEGIGVVRDVESELGHGGRVGRRRREKGF